MDLPKENHLEAKFHDFYEANYRKIYNFVRAKKFPYNHLNDLVSKIFEICWRRFGEYVDRPDVHWIYRIAENACNYERRKFWQARTNVLDSPDFTENAVSANAKNQEQEIISTEEKAEIMQVIAALPGKQREVFILRLNGYTYEEIATSLGVSGEAVRKRMLSAVAKCRHLIVPLLRKL